MTISCSSRRARSRSNPATSGHTGSGLEANHGSCEAAASHMCKRARGHTSTLHVTDGASRALRRGTHLHRLCCAASVCWVRNEHPLDQLPCGLGDVWKHLGPRDPRERREGDLGIVWQLTEPGPITLLGRPEEEKRALRSSTTAHVQVRTQTNKKYSQTPPHTHAHTHGPATGRCLSPLGAVRPR